MSSHLCSASDASGGEERRERAGACEPCRMAC